MPLVHQTNLGSTAFNQDAGFTVGPDIQLKLLTALFLSSDRFPPALHQPCREDGPGEPALLCTFSHACPQWYPQRSLGAAAGSHLPCGGAWQCTLREVRIELSFG
ncbi:hypothetical protein SAMN00790413_06544 [Deinococcus hopiensis KR-140]|uniref:Uncharacterized protein n=1 Tax=Deinococcus hopiensis KR-140 TaxID=695939 RepID=A0A1W1UAR8_9DEIO|nr:hypothetical protein SAMN00790413_06544 [Deinococcus hopiensis KR-140]